MIKILTWSPDDGWAFFKENSNLYLIKPPFNHSPREVTKTVVDGSMTIGGFQAGPANEFTSKEALITFLRSNVKE